jgi:hypothetical protein
LLKKKKKNRSYLITIRREDPFIVAALISPAKYPSLRIRGVSCEIGYVYESEMLQIVIEKPTAFCGLVGKKTIEG